MAGPRVRKKHEHAVDRDTRIKRITKLMATLSYQGEVTLAELGAEWGIPVNSLKNDAAEASRILRHIASDGDEIRTECVAALRAIAAAGIRKGSKSPHYLRAGIDAINAITELKGLRAPTKSELKSEQILQLQSLDVDRETLRRMADEICELPELDDQEPTPSPAASATKPPELRAGKEAKTPAKGPIVTKTA